MSIKTIETDVEDYAKAAGKKVEEVYDEVRAFIAGKKSTATAGAQNVSTAPANPTNAPAGSSQGTGGAAA